MDCASKVLAVSVPLYWKSLAALKTCLVGHMTRARLIYSVCMADTLGLYLGFTDILVSAKTAYFMGFSRCWQNAVLFLMHADSLCKKAQWTMLRQLSCCNNSRCIFINKQTKWTMEHASSLTAKTKVSSLIRLIVNDSKILKLLQFEKF